MNFDSPRSFGLMAHISHVAFSPARFLTSYVRRRYRDRYVNHLRYPRLLFGYDLIMFAVAVFAIVAMFAAVRAPKTPVSAMALFFSSPVLRSAEVVPLDVAIRSQDDQDRTRLRLTWQLPPHTEILSSSLPLMDGQEMVIESLPAGKEIHVRMLVRLFVPEGDVRFGFRLTDGIIKAEGAQTRRVVGSALTLASFVAVDALGPDGRAPLRLFNTSHRLLTDVRVICRRGCLVDDQMSQAIDALEPGEERVLIAQIDPFGADIEMAVGEHVLSALSLTGARDASVQHRVQVLKLDASQVWRPTHLVIETAADVDVVVWHPSLLGRDPQGIRTFSVPSGSHIIDLPLHHGPVDASRWYVWPFSTINGKRIAGSLVSAPMIGIFEVHTAVRYYGSTGDQLGRGPHPPEVGKDTRYWVQWKLDPSSVDRSDVHIEAALPSGVHVTGRSALVSGGSIYEQNGAVGWTRSYLPASSQETSVAFEIVVQPGISMKGDFMNLLGETRAWAADSRGASVYATALPVDSRLSEDVKAQALGDGRVK